MPEGYGHQTVPLQASLINGVWEIDWTASTSVDVIITKIVITGPLGSRIYVYIDNTMIDVALRGDVNSNELLNPHVLKAGQTLRLVWTLGTGSPATATLMMRTYKEYR